MDGWLTIREINFLIVLEAVPQGSSGHRVVCSPQALERPFLSLPSSGSCPTQRSLACGYITPMSVSLSHGVMSVCPRFPFYEDTGHRIWTHRNPV